MWRSLETDVQSVAVLYFGDLQERERARVAPTDRVRGGKLTLSEGEEFGAIPVVGYDLDYKDSFHLPGKTAVAPTTWSDRALRPAVSAKRHLGASPLATVG